jgi:uncharacterized protein (TIGR03545 family)
MMKNIIRWPGLIAFFVISGLIAAIIILFLDFWIKLAAENGIAEATGAEVNIAEVSHTFSPFGITLAQVQLTDPKQPSHNQAQASEITAQIDLVPLLLRKVIIDDLTISGVEVNQLRESEGDVYRVPDSTEDDAASISPSSEDIPSVDEILAKSPLKTSKAVEETQQAYDKHSEKLQQQYAQLPDKAKLADYKERMTTLSKADYKNPLELAAAKKEFNQLKKEISEDQQKLNAFKQSAEEAKQDLAPKLAQLKAAPGQDYEQLKALIAGDAAAINDVTTLVFGDKVAQWSQYALAAFEIAGPMLAGSAEEKHEKQRTEGRWVDFGDTTALPDLLIRKALISLTWQEENIVSHWEDITHQHEKIGRPTLFNVDSSSSKLWQSLKVDGDFWLSDGGAKAQQKWDLSGLKLTDLNMLEQEKLSSTLQKALLNSVGSVAINQNLVSGNAVVDLKELVMSASGSNNLTEVIANTLTQINKLTINTEVGGTLGDLDLTFSSDLDKQLGSAMLTNLSGDQKGKLAELKQKLNAKIAGPLEDSDGQMTQWLEWEKLADGDLGSISELLQSQMDSVVDDKKDELKDKLKDKLKGKLFG